MIAKRTVMPNLKYYTTRRRFEIENSILKFEIFIA